MTDKKLQSDQLSPQPGMVIKAGFFSRHKTAVVFLVMLLGCLAALVFLWKKGPQLAPKAAVSEPWSFAREKIDKPLPKPTKDELITLLKNARLAMATGQETDKYLSAEMLWMANNEVEGTGRMKDNLPVNVIKARNSGKYFSDMLATLPPLDSLEYGDVIYSVEDDNAYTPEYFVEDPGTKTLTKHIVTRWKYWTGMTVYSREGSDRIRGEVRFVYDRGTWKYHFEDWILK